MINSSFLIELLHLINHKHNNFITVGGATNLFACLSTAPEKCTRVSTFSVANNNTFECHDKHIGINLLNVLD